MIYSSRRNVDFTNYDTNNVVAERRVKEKQVEKVPKIFLAKLVFIILAVKVYFCEAVSTILPANLWLPQCYCIIAEVQKVLNIF